MDKRVVDVAVISDVHLGTYACRARELLAYLRSINPRLLILNGDIIDGWQFTKHYFPALHMEVVRQILEMNASGTRLIYITGNHDEMLRRYSGMQLGSFQLTDKLLLEINGRSTWIFHGDVFDRTTSGQARLLTRLGSNGYALLLGFNKFMNRCARFFGRPPSSFANSVMKQFNKRFVKLEAFEQLVGELAVNKGYDYVICGHTHQSANKSIVCNNGSVMYLNSGDWVQSMTALEFRDNEWFLYKQEEDQLFNAGAQAATHSMSHTGEATGMSELAILFHALKKRAVLQKALNLNN